MITGGENPNRMAHLEKMTIKNLDENKSFEVLYNPVSYVQKKSVSYGRKGPLGADAGIVQFHSGHPENLTFELFFDTMSAGMEVGGKKSDRQKIADNSAQPSSSNAVDVREYTSKVYSLAFINENKHRPPELEITWSSLLFKCFLLSCTQKFIKFSEDGTPVRATLDCVFVESRDLKKLFGKKSPQSPDTTKYRATRQGDSLWAMAFKEYDDAAQWREIASANGIDNPRTLRTGDLLVVPALPR